jgi:hypothetical protein
MPLQLRDRQNRVHCGTVAMRWRSSAAALLRFTLLLNRSLYVGTKVSTGRSIARRLTPHSVRIRLTLGLYTVTYRPEVMNLVPTDSQCCFVDTGCKRRKREVYTSLPEVGVGMRYETPTEEVAANTRLYVQHNIQETSKRKESNTSI